MTKTRSSSNHQGNGTQISTATNNNKSKKTSKGQEGVNGKIKQRQTNSVKTEASAESRNANKKAGGAEHRNGNHSLDSELQRLKKMREDERHEREGIVLWKRPFTTLHYFSVELCLNVHEYAVKMWTYKKTVCLALLVLLLSVVAYHSPGPHQALVVDIEKQVLWCLYWLGLGVLSSVGLGTGLHTFLLYLGPHIAAVTLAAYECGTLDFPSPPYPDSIICPPEEKSSAAQLIPVTLWSIMSKVRLEAMMWGAGTALGELPPYFMARAARLSTLGGGRGRRGSRRRSSLELSDDVEKLAEFEALQQKQKHPEQMTLMDRLKLAVERLVERVGFFGILACASIPNPLFDLAGITCGHFLVPFWTFFGATLIGKAIIKTHLQQLTVIVAFNENLVNKLVTGLATIPVIGSRLQEPLEQLLKTQKAKLHSKDGTVDPSDASGGSLLASLFEKLVLVMVIYFVLSILNSLAQNYHHRLCSQKHALAGATPPPSRPGKKSNKNSTAQLAKRA